MDDLTPAQLAAKIAYLERENAQLRSENLNLRVRAGLIRLAPATPETDATASEDGGEDG